MPQDDEIAVAQVPEQPEAALAFLAIRTVVPADMRAVSADTILEIREKYGAELRSFHDAMRAISTDAALDRVTDREALDLWLQDLYDDRIAPKLKQLDRDLRLFSIDTATTWLGVKTSLPPAAAALAGGVGLDMPEIGTAGAVVLGVAGIRASSVAGAREQLARNPAAYLLRVREALAPATLGRQIAKAIRKLTHGV